jgi:lysozyme
MATRTPARLIKRWLIIMLIAVLCALGIWLYAQRWAPSPATYPMQGVDVSHHQGPIDWQSVAAAGAKFAYIKASEGGDVRDAAFATNWREAGEAGLRRGGYHFFTLCRLASDQATNFIATVPRDPAALPPVIDLEFGGNCVARPDRQVLLGEIASFIRLVEAHSGQPVILYITAEFDEVYRVSEAVDRPLWLRRHFIPPSYGAHPWVMWQASSLRRVQGISGPVDWNVVRDGG